jgi:D-hexose-6-phosphate mutarotase
MYTIKNNSLEVSVQKTGIELCSIKSVSSGKEYMWDANPDVWGSYAPVLFPIIGSLKDDGYTFKGKEYSLPKHGMVRHNSDIELIESNSNTLVFRLKYNTEKRRCCFLLEGIRPLNALSIKVRITAITIWSLKMWRIRLHGYCIKTDYRAMKHVRFLMIAI